MRTQARRSLGKGSAAACSSKRSCGHGYTGSSWCYLSFGPKTINPKPYFSPFGTLLGTLKTPQTSPRTGRSKPSRNRLRSRSRLLIGRKYTVRSSLAEIQAGRRSLDRTLIQTLKCCDGGQTTERIEKGFALASFGDAEFQPFWVSLTSGCCGLELREPCRVLGARGLQPGSWVQVSGLRCRVD